MCCGHGSGGEVVVGVALCVGAGSGTAGGRSGCGTDVDAGDGDTGGGAGDASGASAGDSNGCCAVSMCVSLTTTFIACGFGVLHRINFLLLVRLAERIRTFRGSGCLIDHEGDFLVKCAHARMEVKDDIINERGFNEPITVVCLLDMRYAHRIGHRGCCFADGRA